MSLAALMLVKDEADIIRYTLDHLRQEVDWVFVYDNGSTDGTRDILEEFASAGNPPMTIINDAELGYYQSKKTSALAQRALEHGFQWVIPCDADEWWTTETDGRPIKDFLAGITPDVYIVNAKLYHYFPTQLDATETERPNPYQRIRWRTKEHAAFPKVCCRTHPTLTIEAGNHGAQYGSPTYLTTWGLRVSHFSWRSPEQYIQKIRNGVIAYDATNLPESTGAHWRMQGPVDDPDFHDRVERHYFDHFWRRDPEGDGHVQDPLV